MSLTAETTSAPNFESRSNSKNRCGCLKAHASRNCCTIQRALGFRVTFEVQDLTPIVADNEKAMQNTKGERWDGKEIHCSNGLAMIHEERQPSLRGIWISRRSPNPSRDTPFRKIETQFDQFAVNARCSPGRILGNHTEDQGANLLADVLTSNLSGS